MTKVKASPASEILLEASSSGQENTVKKPGLKTPTLKQVIEGLQGVMVQCT